MDKSLQRTRGRRSASGSLRLTLVALTTVLTAVVAALTPTDANAATHHSKTYSTGKVCVSRDAGKVRICTWIDYYIIEDHLHQLRQSARTEIYGTMNKKLQAEDRELKPGSTHSQEVLETPSIGGTGTLNKHTGYIGCNRDFTYRVAAPYSYFAPKPTNAWIHGTIYGPYYKIQGRHHGNCEGISVPPI